MRRPGRGTLVGVALCLAVPALAQPVKTPLPPQPPAASTAPPASNVDLAYGAYERGFYLTAFNEAMKRAQQNDAAAMTLLGELYAQGLGVGKDDAMPRRGGDLCDPAPHRAGADDPDHARLLRSRHALTHR